MAGRIIDWEIRIRNRICPSPLRPFGEQVDRFESQEDCDNGGLPVRISERGCLVSRINLEMQVRRVPCFAD
jgi:hypothetical protein